MEVDHHYAVSVRWEGNHGSGTSGYRDYGSDNTVSADGRPAIAGSSDPVFRGAHDRWNPEQLLVAALSQCHMLSYLYVAVKHGVVVTAYSDNATGTMRQTEDGGGHFTQVTLAPVVTISAGDPELARTIHAEAYSLCFIAQSMNFPVRHEPTILIDQRQDGSAPTAVDSPVGG